MCWVCHMLRVKFSVYSYPLIHTLGSWNIFTWSAIQVHVIVNNILSWFISQDLYSTIKTTKYNWRLWLIRSYEDCYIDLILLWYFASMWWMRIFSHLIISRGAEGTGREILQRPPSVHPSVCPSVCLSVCLSVTFSFRTVTKKRIDVFSWNFAGTCTKSWGCAV